MMADAGFSTSMIRIKHRSLSIAGTTQKTCSVSVTCTWSPLSEMNSGSRKNSFDVRMTSGGNVAENMLLCSGGTLSARQMSLNLLHIWIEAHRQHPVGLVKHSHSQRVEQERSAQQVVEDTSRSAHDNLGATFERIDLRTVPDTSVDGDGPESGWVTQHFGLLRHLLGQLAGGHQDEGLAHRSVGVEAFEHRQQEGPGLPAPGAGLHHHVLGIEKAWNRTSLHRHELGPPGPRNRIAQ